MARRWAVLIDAENVSADVADPLFERVLGWGDACVRRMFGNFDGNHLAWKDAGDRHSIERVHLSRLTQGKNGADIALVIDALDLMHRGHVDGFCLVSSDSDFTRLAWRLRAEGKTVRGVGDDKAVEALRTACSEFILIEQLISRCSSDAVPDASPVRAVPKITVRPACGRKDPALAIPSLEKAIARLEQGREWQGLNAVGAALRKVDPRFRAKDHAECGSLLSVVEKSGGFRIRRDENNHPEIARKP